MKGVKVRLNQLICPDDADASAPCPLTYVVNAGVYNDPRVTVAGVACRPLEPKRNPPSPGGLGIFRYYYREPWQTPWPMGIPRVEDNPQIGLTNVKSASQTVMLSERAWPSREWTDTVDTSTGRTNLLSGVGTVAMFSFTWPNYQPLLAPVEQPDNTTQLPILRETLIGVTTAMGGVVYPAPLLGYLKPASGPIETIPLHRGIVIVTFCDGHVESLADDTRCDLYLATP